MEPLLISFARRERRELFHRDPNILSHTLHQKSHAKCIFIFNKVLRNNGWASCVWTFIFFSRFILVGKCSPNSVSLLVDAVFSPYTNYMLDYPMLQQDWLSTQLQNIPLVIIAIIIIIIIIHHHHHHHHGGVDDNNFIVNMIMMVVV